LLSPMASRYIYLSLIIFLIGLLGLILANQIGDLMLSALNSVACAMKISKRRITLILLDKLDEMVQSFQRVTNFKTYFTVFVVSIFIWLCQFSLYYFLLRSIGVELTFGKALIGMMFASLTNILPISGVGGFGTMEAGCAIGLTLVGLSKETAIISGFAVHIWVLIIIIVFGSVGLVYLRLHSLYSQHTYE